MTISKVHSKVQITASAASGPGLRRSARNWAVADEPLQFIAIGAVAGGAGPRGDPDHGGAVASTKGRVRVRPAVPICLLNGPYALES